MTTQDLKNKIDSVLGNSLRCLLPSYWWKKLFYYVVDKIDGINGVDIVDSKVKLNKLDVPQGSVASVATRKTTKLSECYVLTDEDSGLSDEELYAKLTPIKGVEVGASIPQIPNDSYYTCNLVNISDTSILGSLTLYNFGGFKIASAAFQNVSSGSLTEFLLPSQLSQLNEYLSKNDVRFYSNLSELDSEAAAAMEEYFTIVDSNTDVYVKGMAWEKLAKEGESGTSTPSASAKYELYVSVDNEDLADAYINKNKEVVEEVLKGDIQPYQILLTFQNSDGSNATSGLYMVDSIRASVENNQDILLLYASSLLQVYDDGVKSGGELKLVFKTDGSVRWSQVVATLRPVVFIPRLDTSEQVTTSQKADNVKMFEVLKAVLKNKRAELPNLVLSIPYNADRINVSPSVYYYVSGTNTEGQLVEGIFFTALYANSVFMSAVLYSDGNAKGQTIAIEAQVTIDTALSTSSANPVQNKVVTEELNKKQPTLVSGTNIKTINGIPILGSGDIKVAADITVDSSLSSSSTNPVQNKAVYEALQGKASTSALNSKVSASDIKTINGVSILGGGNLQLGDGQTIVYDDTEVLAKIQINEDDIDDVFDEIDAIWDEVDGIVDDIKYTVKDLDSDIESNTNYIYEVYNEMLKDRNAQDFYNQLLRGPVSLYLTSTSSRSFPAPLLPGFVITDFNSTYCDFLKEDGNNLHVNKDELPYTVVETLTGVAISWGINITIQGDTYTRIQELESRLAALENK